MERISYEEITRQIKYCYEHNPNYPIEVWLVPLIQSCCDTQLSADRSELAEAKAEIVMLNGLLAMRQARIAELEAQVRRQHNDLAQADLELEMARLASLEDGELTEAVKKILKTHRAEPYDDGYWEVAQEIVSLLSARLEKERKRWDEPCPHVHKVLVNRPKRACDICWKEG